jgi:hypothetical protein
VVEEGGGHLAAAGVVDADEQDLGGVFHGGSLGVGGPHHPSTALTAVDIAWHCEASTTIDARSRG